MARHLIAKDPGGPRTAKPRRADPEAVVHQCQPLPGRDDEGNDPPRAHPSGRHLWARAPAANGFLEALNGLCQAAQCKACGLCAILV